MGNCITAEVLPSRNTKSKDLVLYAMRRETGVTKDSRTPRPARFNKANFEHPTKPLARESTGGSTHESTDSISAKMLKVVLRAVERGTSGSVGSFLLHGSFHAGVNLPARAEKRPASMDDFELDCNPEVMERAFSSNSTLESDATGDDCEEEPEKPRIWRRLYPAERNVSESRSRAEYASESEAPPTEDPNYPKPKPKFTPGTPPMAFQPRQSIRSFTDSWKPIGRPQLEKL